MNKQEFNRRHFLMGASACSALTLLGTIPVLAQVVPTPNPSNIIKKVIPSSNEKIPVIGMGTWITFNVGQDVELRNQRTEVLKEFVKYGGGMVDCSPMYGSSAEVLGYAMRRITNTDRIFSASKVWTSWTGNGPDQMEAQRRSWGIANFDLMQIHNLMNWEGHLETLKNDKEEGKIRYIGVTTSHGRRHSDLEKIMNDHDLDFVQLTYNIVDREVENRLLPLAKDRGIAVIANRPYKGGALFEMMQKKSLPVWAIEEAGVKNWAEFFLKFIVSHPSITCAVPATSKVQHMRENMGSAHGRLLDTNMRERMHKYVQSI